MIFYIKYININAKDTTNCDNPIINDILKKDDFMKKFCEAKINDLFSGINKLLIKNQKNESDVSKILKNLMKNDTSLDDINDISRFLFEKLKKENSLSTWTEFIHASHRVVFTKDYDKYHLLLLEWIKYCGNII